MKYQSKNFLKLKFKIFFCLITLSHSLNSQICVYQDVFKGGVTGDGFNPWYFNESGNFNIQIEPNSTIRKAYLFVSVYETPDTRTLNFNGTNIELNIENSIEINNTVITYTNITNYIVKPLIIEVTNLINPLISTYPITPPLNQPSPNLGGAFVEYYLFVAYENTALPIINTSIFVNDKDAESVQQFPLLNLNPINLSQDVGLAIHSSHFCDTFVDGSYVKVSNINIGLIGGKEDNSNIECAGVTGSFYYQNSTLFGLSNDSADNFMKGSDGLANINSYLTSSTNVNIEFDYQSNKAPESNPVLQLFLAYSTPCDTFPYTISDQITSCKNEQVQLLATGGTQYLWQSSRASDLLDLSCTTCPNPIFSGDSSRVYTVQIWNSDSCSVIRPVSIKVYDTPSLGVFDLSLPDCGANNGSLNIATNNDSIVSYQLDNQNIQTEGIFNGLSKGIHTIFFTDKNGCSSDSTFSFSDTIRTNAYFKASPSYGFLPLEINFDNLSTFATNYVWSIETESINVETFSELENYTFDSSGYYFIELKAWQFDASCADSFTLKITVYDNFMYQIPNIFSPKNDNVNDVFGISANVPISVKYLLLNRWGNVIAEGNSKSSQLDKFVSIWDGKDASEGVYFYQLEIDLIDELFLPKIDLGQEKNKIEFPIKKEGFLQLVR